MFRDVGLLHFYYALKSLVRVERLESSFQDYGPTSLFYQFSIADRGMKILLYLFSYMFYIASVFFHYSHNYSDEIYHHGLGITQRERFRCRLC